MFPNQMHTSSTAHKHNSKLIHALQLQASIGAKSACAFDLTAACSGFVLGIITAGQYIRTGASKKVLVVGGDALSRFVDWRDRGEWSFPHCTSCTISDGALCSANDVPASLSKSSLNVR